MRVVGWEILERLAGSLPLPLSADDTGDQIRGHRIVLRQWLILLAKHWTEPDYCAVDLVWYFRITLFKTFHI